METLAKKDTPLCLTEIAKLRRALVFAIFRWRLAKLCNCLLLFVCRNVKLPANTNILVFFRRLKIYFILSI